MVVDFSPILIKEQVAAWIMLLLVPVAFLFAFHRIKRKGGSVSSLTEGDKSIYLATLLFCVIVASSVFFVLAINGKMALNVRYVFPSLPAVYFSVGVAWQICITRPRVVRWSIILLITMSGIESIIVCPFYFSYVNPAVGGMYRMPPALHASNFDGGQDLWRLERLGERSGQTRRSWHLDLPSWNRARGSNTV